MKVCVVGASGKLGQYMVQHALDRSYDVVAVCREQSVGKLDRFKGQISVVPGATDDRDVQRADRHRPPGTAPHLADLGAMDRVRENSTARLADASR